jgi:hypothetical protein
MTQIVVVKDEWYGWFATDTSPTESRGSEVVLNVRPTVARRWQKATDDFAKAMKEIQIAVDKKETRRD